MNTQIHTYIHTYIHVLLKNRKINFFVDKYVRARFYRKMIDAGSYIYELNNYFRKDYIYE